MKPREFFEGSKVTFVLGGKYKDGEVIRASGGDVYTVRYENWRGYEVRETMHADRMDPK